MQHSRGPQGGPARAGGGFGGGEPVISKLLRSTETVDYFVAKRNDSDRRPAPKAELFDQAAEKTAEKLAAIPASQLRRFFSAVMGIRRRLDLDAKLDADFIAAEMALLKARAAYTLARRKGNRRDSQEEQDELLAFFVRHARSVRDRPSFAAFMRHFEAVMAFHKVHEKKQGRD